MIRELSKPDFDLPTEHLEWKGEIPDHLTENLFHGLAVERVFILRYHYGDIELSEGTVQSCGFNLFRRLEERLLHSDKMGEWSFAHHAYHGDFFPLFLSVLEETPGLGKREWPPASEWAETLLAGSRRARDAGDSAQAQILSHILFRGIRKIQEALLRRFESTVRKTWETSAEGFLKGGGEEIRVHASSLDWFQQEWGRDAFVSLPGLLLARGRFDDALSVIRRFAHLEKNGLIPNRISDPSRPETIEYNTADASLWFVQAVRKFIEATGEWNLPDEILRTLGNIFQGYRRGTGYERQGRRLEIRMDADGLIITPPQGTWMDAHPNPMPHPVTSRHGKAVEINALWYSALRFLETLGRKQANRNLAIECGALAARVQAVFNEKFWNASEAALYDVVEGDPHQGAIRPNMIFAISLEEDLIPSTRQASVLKAVAKYLLTPFGLRTLSPLDSHYHGHYHTELLPQDKDLAYHQGTVWPWLMGAYVDALKRVRRKEGKMEREIQGEIRQVLAPLLEFLMTSPVGSLPEVFDGDAPYRPGGTRSQAWSVAEVFRVFPWK